VSGGDGKPRLLFEANSFNEADGQVPPDGHWVAYTSDESGKNRVCVRPFPGPGGKTPISIEGGQEPRWSRDERELFYRDPDKNQLMAVDIPTSPALRAGQAHALFALGNVPWDVSPDGKRFLVVKPEAEPREAKMFNCSRNCGGRHRRGRGARIACLHVENGRAPMPDGVPGSVGIRNGKCASSEGWHEQWVRIPPG